MAIQERNPEMVDLLRADFQARNEPNFAWKSAVSSVLALPGLRAFYPMSVVGGSGQAQDISSLARHMTRTSDPDFGYQNLIPYSRYNGTTDYHSVADNADHDIIGTEAYVNFPGLTIGLWVKKITLQGGGNIYLFNKWEAAAANRSYGLYHNGTSVIFGVYSAANVLTSVTLANSIAADATWYFIWGRYEPSGDLTVGVNNVINTNIGGGPAALFNSSADLTIGARSGGSNHANCRISLAWLCCQQHSDAIMRATWEQQRAMFNR